MEEVLTNTEINQLIRIKSYLTEVETDVQVRSLAFTVAVLKEGGSTSIRIMIGKTNSSSYNRFIILPIYYEPAMILALTETLVNSFIELKCK
jgi:hypothetical protein